MADSKVSALPAVTPAGTDHVYLVDASDGSSKKGTVDLLLEARGGAVNVLSATVGMVNDGATDNASALAALASGVYVFPAGTYYFKSDVTITQTGDLALIGMPGAIFYADDSGSTFGTGASNGNLISHATSGGPHGWLLIDGIEFQCDELPGSTSTWDPGSTDFPPGGGNGTGSSATAAAFSSFDARLDRMTIRNCRFYMDSATASYHSWVNAGGDSAVGVDLEEVRLFEFYGNEVYASRDSSPYMKQVGTRGDSVYPAKLNVYGNYYEGCGTGPAAKGALLGGSIHHNHFVNCARPINCTEGNADVSDRVKIHDNEIDGYWRAFWLAGDSAIVRDNHVFNAGHFYFPSGVETSIDAASTDGSYFDQPIVVHIEKNLTGTTDPDHNQILHNLFEGYNATSGSRGRSTSWAGSDPYVFEFVRADDNRAFDNIITGTEWSGLALSTLDTIGAATYDETGGGVEDEWTLNGHDLSVGDLVQFSAVGTGASGYAVDTDYWVAAVPDANTFTLAATPGGTAIAGSGDSSGTWTLVGYPDGNIITWSTAEMIEDHSLMDWTNQASTEFAKGPMFDEALNADDSGSLSTTGSPNWRTVPAWTRSLPAGVHARIEGDLLFTGSATALGRIGFGAAGSEDILGSWSLLAMHEGDTSEAAAQGVFSTRPFDAEGSNYIAFGLNDTTTWVPVKLTGHCEIVTGGDLEFKYRQDNADDSNATILRAYSSYRIIRVK